MNRREAATGVHFWFALVFSLLLSVSGTFILITNQDPEMSVIGWVLVGIGSIFVALNIALRQQRQ